MTSTENVVRLRHARADLAFLPAALEIVEAPPSPIGRATALTIALALTLGLIWAASSKVDIIASAAGKIIPSGRTKVVQPFETGVVRAIHVQDGQRVSAGDVLIELDPRINEAEEGHVRSDLIAAQLDIARLEAALASDNDPLGSFNPPADAEPGAVAMQRQYLEATALAHRAKLAALDNQRQQKQAERASVAAAITKLEAVIPVVQQRVDIRKVLVDGGNGSKLTYLENLQSLLEYQNDLLVQKSHLRETEAALASITETIEQTEAEYRRSLFTELTEARRKAAGLAHDVEKATDRRELQRLTAPVDGIVQQLAVHTVGGVVTAAQPLLIIVPANRKLEIEATVRNRDIGFVRVGQKAEIKIDTFTFTRYGLLHGEITDVSADAMSSDVAANRRNERPMEPERADETSRDLNYVARISLDQTTMQIDDKLADLEPGMAVTVEIKTGSRSVLGFLLSPLLRYTHDALRER